MSIVVSSVVGSVSASSLVLTGFKCKADHYNLVWANFGPSNTVKGRVQNTAALSVDGRVDFNFRSLNGAIGSVSSTVTTFSPSQTTDVTAQITVPNASDIYIVSCILVETATNTPVASNTFKFEVS